jgi:hypothetical protein
MAPAWVFFYQNIKVRARSSAPNDWIFPCTRHRPLATGFEVTLNRIASEHVK